KLSVRSSLSASSGRGRNGAQKSLVVGNSSPRGTTPTISTGAPRYPKFAKWSSSAKIAAMPCSCAAVGATARHFDEARARQELASLLEHGPAVTTEGLLGELAALGSPPESMLDVGSGIGALVFGLLERGVLRATAVDISGAALGVQAEEAERRGLAARVELHEGDFVELAPRLPVVDLVTLDRVVCCYPAHAPLLDAAAAHSRRLLALSFPRDRWWVRLMFVADNFWRRLRRDAFRTFVHPPRAMSILLEDRGFTRRRVTRSWTWQIEVYERTPARGSPGRS
ncbi:MAG: class I SAM-dependent methyltransferase, partial [Myxococcota bacterium]